MTTRDDDHDLDAFLNGEDDLSALLRGLPQSEPEPGLDARIQAQAREALAVPAAAANDPAPADAQPGPRTPLGRLRAPLALAATVVIGVSLGLQWDGWREPARTLSDVAPAPAHAPAEPGAPDASPSVPALPADAKAAHAPARRGEAHRRRDGARPPASVPAAAPPAPVVAPDAVVAEPASVAPPPPPAPAPAAAPLDGIYRRAAPAPAREGGLVSGYAPPPDATSHVTVTGSRAATRAEPDAEAWLARITALLDQHRDAQARASWQAFRRAFPEAQVPPALQARIDALATPEPPAP